MDETGKSVCVVICTPAAATTTDQQLWLSSDREHGYMWCCRSRRAGLSDGDGDVIAGRGGGQVIR